MSEDKDFENLLQDALNKFITETERLKQEHRAEIEKILKEVKARKLEAVKKDLGI